MGSSEDAKRPARGAHRARGEGSIWKDGKTGRWWYAISVDGKQYKYRAPDKQTAAACLKQLKEGIDHGVMPGKPIQLGKHAQEWMDKVVANLKPKTRIFYRQTTEHYVLPYLGEHTPLKKVSAVTIIDMMNLMRRAGYAEQTIDHAYTVGKTIFEHARKWRRIIFNPFDDVDPPEVKKVEPTPLSRAELNALRYEVETHRLYVLYELGWTLGIRKGELLGLTIEGIDLKAATITISQQVLDLDDGPSIEPYTKNDEIRTLPLTPRLVALVRIRLEQLLAERGEGWQEHGLLFPSEHGTPMSERNLDRHFKGACLRAEIRLRDTGKTKAKGRGNKKRELPIYKSDMKFHHLRHSTLSWLGDTGASDMVIKAIAGHADETVTDRYVHISLAAMRQAIERMEQAKILRQDDDETAAERTAEAG